MGQVLEPVLQVVLEVESGGLGGGEKGGIGEGGGLGLSDMVDTDAVKESAAEVAQAVVDGVKETMDSYPDMWDSPVSAK